MFTRIFEQFQELITYIVQKYTPERQKKSVNKKKGNILEINLKKVNTL
jgi:hypothetical protein